MKITGEDCRSCGACCVGGYDDGEGWAYCTAADVVRMTRHARSRLVGARYEETSRSTPAKMTDDFGKICAFLRGTPGKRVSCAIYETRPAVCAKFKPGGEACRGARAELGLPQ